MENFEPDNPPANQ